MRIAFVETVKNEEDLVADHIRYHSHLGGTDFLFYIDDSTDRTADILRAFPHAVIKRSALPPHCLGQADLRWVVEKYRTHHTARQILNCHDAIAWARKNRIEWLVSIDPDELICLDKAETRKNHLAEFLASLPSHVNAVSFPSLEVIPTCMTYTQVFREARLFKRNYGFGESRRLRGEGARSRRGNAPLPRSGLLGREETWRKWDEGAIPGADRRLRAIVDSAAFGEYVLDVPPMILEDRRNDRVVVSDWYLGHATGKQAFRVDRDLRILSLHEVQCREVQCREAPFQSACPTSTTSAGCLLHYNNYSAEKFLVKYTQSGAHPPEYSSGYPVDPSKRLLRGMVNDPRVRRPELLRWFGDTFVFGDDRLSRVADLWNPAIERVEGVAEFFNSRRV